MLVIISCNWIRVLILLVQIGAFVHSFFFYLAYVVLIHAGKTCPMIFDDELAVADGGKSVCARLLMRCVAVHDGVHFQKVISCMCCVGPFVLLDFFVNLQAPNPSLREFLYCAPARLWLELAMLFLFLFFCYLTSVSFCNAYLVRRIRKKNFLFIINFDFYTFFCIHCSFWNLFVFR